MYLVEALAQICIRMATTRVDTLSLILYIKNLFNSVIWGEIDKRKTSRDNNVGLGFENEATYEYMIYFEVSCSNLDGFIT